MSQWTGIKRTAKLSLALSWKQVVQSYEKHIMTIMIIMIIENELTIFFFFKESGNHSVVIKTIRQPVASFNSHAAQKYISQEQPWSLLSFFIY